MNLGDVTQEDRAEDVPGRAAARTAARSATRTFIPHRVHEAIGVLGAVSVATACVMPGSVAAQVAKRRRRRAGSDSKSSIRPDSSPSTWKSRLDGDRSGARSALLRTARKLMRGEVFVPGARLEPRMSAAASACSASARSGRRSPTICARAA